MRAKLKCIENKGQEGGPGICGTQVKSSSNKYWMSPARRSDGAYFSETPPSSHVGPYFSLMAIVLAIV